MELFLDDLDDLRSIDLSTGIVSSGYEPTRGSYLILWLPKAYTPVSPLELGSVQFWLPLFNKIGFEVVGASVDHEEDILAWYDSNEALRDSQYTVLCSTQLASRFNLLRSGDTLKKASVFFTDDGELVIQEHFNGQSRDMGELYRQAKTWRESRR